MAEQVPCYQVHSNKMDTRGWVTGQWLQWKFMSFERSIDFNRIQNVSICGSSSAVIQNLGKRDIK